MELFKEILTNLLSREKMQITFPDLKLSPEKIVELECYTALKRIKAVIEDDNLDDRDCFSRIERIIGEFEEIGSDGATRHDF